MDLESHEKLCVKELDKPYTEIHVFLDSYQQKYRGFSHRRILHHRLGIEACVKQFGETARKPAELHIKQDMGFVPETWKDLENHTFPLLDEEFEQEKDLIVLYGNDCYDTIEQSGID